MTVVAPRALRLGGDLAAEAKVADHQGVVLREQQVVALDVTMDELALVEMRDALACRVQHASLDTPALVARALHVGASRRGLGARRLFRLEEHVQIAARHHVRHRHDDVWARLAVLIECIAARHDWVVYEGAADVAEEARVVERAEDGELREKVLLVRHALPLDPLPLHRDVQAFVRPMADTPERARRNDLPHFKLFDRKHKVINGEGVRS